MTVVMVTVLDPQTFKPMQPRDLPEPGVRWTCARKARVLLAIEAGLLTRMQARSRYALSEEELSVWEADYRRGGLERLKQRMFAADRAREKAALWVR